MKRKGYYIGIDMGSASLGIAATDTNYNILKINGRDMIDVHLFEEGQTAKKRRLNRSARRMLNHKKKRIRFLKEAFKDLVGKACLEELENSYKRGFPRAEYMKPYKTMSHLRWKLIEDESIDDPKLYFVALLHIFKHRGHFYQSAGSETEERTFCEKWENLVKLTPALSGISADKAKDILTDRSLKRKEKVQELKDLCDIDKKDKVTPAVIRALAGNSVNLFTLYPDLEKPDDETKISFSFREFDAKEEEIRKIMPDNPHFELLKDIHDSSVLYSIMQDYTYLSKARVALYEKHEKDLTRLKKLYKTVFGNEAYKHMFRSAASGTYSAYAGSLNSSGKKVRNISSTTSEELYKTIRKDIEKYLADHPTVASETKEEMEYILSETEKENFLPKQMIALNSVIPNSLHRKEAEIILAHAEKHFPELLKKNEYGLTVSEQILAYLTFRMPYYIGPLKGKRSWAVWKEKGPVHPWNLEDRIDVNATIERWINDLIRECTYMVGEKVVPGQSLLWEKYSLLNELNKLKVDGEPVSVELKQELFHEVFLKRSMVKKEHLFNYLKEKKLVTDISQISGIKDKFDNVLANHRKFISVMKGENKELFEEIIYFNTVFGEAKNLYYKKIQSIESLDEKTKKQLKRMNCKGWGKLSKAFLTYQGTDKETGEIVSIIDVLWNTNMNLNEILYSDRYTFHEILENNKKTITLDNLDDYYLSGPVKRTIHVAIRMIKKYVEMIGYPPTKIFIETTRSDQEKGVATKTIAENLRKAVDNFPDEKEKKYWKNLIDAAEQDGSIRNKKKRLFIMQLGKDIYTGESIRLKDLDDPMLYDVDHIIPQSKKKDDSIINNKVLTRKPINQNEKKDFYPIPEKLIQHDLWDKLHKLGLMSDEKFRRLENRKPLTDKQRAEFIARQVVFAGQSSNAFAKIVEAMYPDSKVVYCKPGNVSDFRKQFDLPKVRMVNQDHHAHDAYLNIVVGNVYHTKFTDNPLNFVKTGEHYHLNKVFDFSVERNGETAWEKGENGTIKTVRKALYESEINYSFMTVCRTGALSKVNASSADVAKPESYLPRKRVFKDVQKYGGYKDIANSHMMIVEYEKKGKREKEMFGVPIIYKDMDPTAYCLNILQLENPKVVCPKIKLFSTFVYKDTGYQVLLSGKSGNAFAVRSATPLRLSIEDMKYAKNIEKYTEGKGKNHVTEEDNLRLYDNVYDEIKRIGVSGTLYSVMENGRDKFISLSVEKQVEVLDQIFQLTQVGNAVKADLTLIGGKKNVGLKKIPASLNGFSYRAC